MLTLPSWAVSPRAQGGVSRFPAPAYKQHMLQASDTVFPVTLVDAYNSMTSQTKLKKLCWQSTEAMRLDSPSATSKEMNTYDVEMVLLWKAGVSNT